MQSSQVQFCSHDTADSIILNELIELLNDEEEQVSRKFAEDMQLVTNRCLREGEKSGILRIFITLGLLFVADKKESYNT